METLHGLAQVKRRGWLHRGVPENDCETVAEHSHAVATYCLALAPIEWRDKAVQIALVHDLAEIVTGDIIPADGISAEQKRSREELAFEYLVSVSPLYGGMKVLWEEYRDKVTPAARFVHDVDKLQRLTRAAQYARKYPEFNFSDFQQDAVIIENVDVRREAEEVINSWNSRGSLKAYSYVLILGGPGVGKGTQSALAARNFDALHVSAGQLLRDEQGRESSPYQSFITESFRRQEPVPAKLIIDLMRKVISGYSGTMVILDGFPITMDQLDYFEDEISTSYKAIHLEASGETLLSRLQTRSLTSQRTDDTADMRSRRVQTFKNRESDVLTVMRTRNRTVLYLDGEGEVEEVQSRVLTALNKH